MRWYLSFSFDFHFGVGKEAAVNMCISSGRRVEVANLCLACELNRSRVHLVLMAPLLVLDCVLISRDAVIERLLCTGVLSESFGGGALALPRRMRARC